MVEAKKLKVWRRGHLQWHDLRTEFHKIYELVQSELGDTDGQKKRLEDRQTDW
jgi:hypothetical protein